MVESKKRKLEFYGVPWYIAIFSCGVIILSMFFGALGTDMPSVLALMLALGIPLNEIGKRIPIWNTYIGGGLLLAFFGASIIGTYQLIPEEYITAIDGFTGSVNFLTLFIVVLLAGSIMSLERTILFKSFMGYFPAILGGLVLAIAFGIIGGMVFGISPSEITTNYVLPVLGGGNAGGAIPLSEIYSEVTGEPSEMYYGFAIIILTVANIIAIIFAALLNRLGELIPSWTGDGTTLMRKSSEDKIKVEDYTPNLKDVAAGFLVALSCYVVGLFFSNFLLPTVFGFPIHQLAYMVIFVIILQAFDVLPLNVRMGAKRLQSFFSKHLTILIMIGVGVELDLFELFAAITVPNIVIAMLVVLGATIGAGFVGYLVGFYPIDTAITAGLCMANRGGSGDIATLGAANRMELMAYAQLSTRLGGALILIIASILFSILL